MYLVVFDGRALKEERAYFFRSGEYCNAIFEKFPQIKTIQKSDIEEILILSLVKDDDALSVRCSKCKNLVIEENNIKIEYFETYDHNEKCGVVKKRLWKYLYNIGVKEKGKQEATPLVCVIENIGSYNAIKNKSLVDDPTFMGEIEEYKNSKRWDKIVAKFPKKENIENTEFWNDTYCLNELYFALSKLCEAGNKKVSYLDKKKYEEYFLFVVERCIDIEPEIYTHKSVLAYHFYNLFVKNKSLSDGGYEKASKIYEELIERSPEKYKEKYRYTKMQQYYFEAFGYTLGASWFKLLTEIIQNYYSLIENFTLLEEAKRKKYKKEYVKSLYGYSTLMIENLFLDWETFSASKLDSTPIKKYYFEKDRLQKVCDVEEYLLRIIKEEKYETGSYKLGENPNYFHVLYRQAQLEQHKGIVYVVKGDSNKANEFFEKSNIIVKQILDIAHQRKDKGDRFSFPHFAKMTRAINYYFLKNEEQSHKCFYNARPYMLYEEAKIYYFCDKKQEALNILREIPSNDMCYEKAQSFMKRIENEL